MIFVIINENNSIITHIFGIFALAFYHILCYLHKAHSDIAKKRHKVFGRIQPLGLLLAAFIYELNRKCNF